MNLWQVCCLFLVLSLETCLGEKKLYPVDKLPKRFENLRGEPAKNVAVRNENNIVRRKMWATEQMLQKMARYEENLRQNRSLLIQNGMAFLVEVLEKAKAIERDQTGKVVRQDPHKINRVVKALENRMKNSQLLKPELKTSSGFGQCSTSMNKAIQIGHLAMNLVREHKRRKRSIVWDPENPDATYPPDYLIPGCHDDPDYDVSCDDLAYVAAVMHEASYKDGHDDDCSGPGKYSFHNFSKLSNSFFIDR